MRSCKYFHGTTVNRLSSIAEHGLLPPERVEALGARVQFPGTSHIGSLYLTCSEYFAQHWTHPWREHAWGIVLCVEVEDKRRLKRDHHLLHQERAYEHLGAILGERIRVHNTRARHPCMPLQEFVERYKTNGEGWLHDLRTEGYLLCQ